MTLFTCNVAVLAIAAIYYTWRDGYMAHLHNERRLRERVAYMLWTAAHRMP